MSIKLIEEFFATGRPLAAVCHGIAAFHQVKDTTGESIFKGRSVTAFSNQEEGMVQLTSVRSILAFRSSFSTDRDTDSMTTLQQQVPFSIEEDIAKQGGTYAHSRSAFVRSTCRPINLELVTILLTPPSSVHFFSREKKLWLIEPEASYLLRVVILLRLRKWQRRFSLLSRLDLAFCLCCSYLSIHYSVLATTPCFTLFPSDPVYLAPVQRTAHT